METPFNMIITGMMTACGKTHYLLKMLKHDYMKHFESITPHFRVEQDLPRLEVHKRSRLCRYTMRPRRH